MKWDRSSTSAYKATPAKLTPLRSQQPSSMSSPTDSNLRSKISAAPPTTPSTIGAATTSANSSNSTSTPTPSPSTSSSSSALGSSKKKKKVEKEGMAAGGHYLYKRWLHSERISRGLTFIGFPIFDSYWLSSSLILVGGGGGSAGTGVESGLMICRRREERRTEAESPLEPLSFLNSNDEIVFQIRPHPNRSLIALAIGSRMDFISIVAEHPAWASVKPEDDEIPVNLHYLYGVRTEATNEKEKRDNSNQCVEWSPDGNWIASGGEDRIIQIWAFQNYPTLSVRLSALCLGRNVAASHSSTSSASHGGDILSLSFSRHRSGILASVGSDSTIRLWDLRKMFEQRSKFEDAAHETATICDDVKQLTEARSSAQRLDRYTEIKISEPEFKFHACKFVRVGAFHRKRVHVHLDETKSHDENDDKTSVAQSDATIRHRGTQRNDEKTSDENKAATSYSHNRNQRSSAATPASEEVLFAIGNRGRRGPGFLFEYVWQHAKATSSAETGVSPSMCLRRRLKIDSAPLLQLSVNDAANLLVVASSERNVYVLHAKTLKVLWKRLDAHSMPHTSLNFSPDVANEPAQHREESEPVLPPVILSVSVDNSILMFNVPRQVQLKAKVMGKNSTSLLLSLIFFLAGFLLTFLFLQSLVDRDIWSFEKLANGACPVDIDKATTALTQVQRQFEQINWQETWQTTVRTATEASQRVMRTVDQYVFKHNSL